MRMMPTRYIGKAQPVVVKKQRAQIAHVTAPVKGISLINGSSAGDPQTATILQNFVIENDHIQVRAGRRKIASRGTSPIWHILPWYGDTPHMAAASNNELWDADNGALLKGGFTSNDWHWTSYADLSSTKYTVMVNGADGVWSWDGGSVLDPAAVAVTNVSKANPCVITVASTDIGKFVNGKTVLMAGAGAAAGWVNVNGLHIISNVGTPANSFTLTGVDTSAAVAAMPTGVTADPYGSIAREVVTAPPGQSAWVDPQRFNIVLAHMNRLWFADTSNLAVYYLPLQQKSGEVKVLPLNALFRRGGKIRALATWTGEGGTGLNDQLCIFSTNGECVIYQGTDPDDAAGGNWQLTGIFRFDSPMSKHCVVNYGGDLYVLISTGVVPMSTLLKAESDHLGQYDQNVVSWFRRNAISFRTSNGWQLMLNPSSGRLFANVPQGQPNSYLQMIRHMTNGAWSLFKNVPARSMNWIDPYIYIGDDFGNVYRMHPVYQADDDVSGVPQAIVVDVQMAWSQFQTPAKKHFLAIQTYMETDGSPVPVIDMKVDYDTSPGWNTPDTSVLAAGALWETAVWDVDYWEPGERSLTVWNGVAPIGHVGAPRLTASIKNVSFAVMGFDVVYERGIFGP